jgi:hypothetical protein
MFAAAVETKTSLDMLMYKLKMTVQWIFCGPKLKTLAEFFLTKTKSQNFY